MLLRLFAAALFLALPPAADRPQEDPAARAAYEALLARHAAAAALDVVATVEQRQEAPGGDGEAVTVLVEGEAHLARPAAGWLRTSTIVLDGGAEDPVEGASEAPTLVSFELLGDGEEIHEVNRRTRTVSTLGDRWFAVFPDVSPLVAWTGRTPEVPRVVEHVEDPSGAGRKGLRILRGGATRDEAREVELLWMTEDGTLAAAESTRRTPEGLRIASFTFRTWRVSESVDVEEYVRRPPVGFADHDAFEAIEDSFLPSGAAAPDVTLQSLAPDGEDLALASLRGQAVLLTFWFEDCPGCPEGLPRTQALWSEVSAERSDVRFVGVHLGDDPAAVRAAWEAAGCTYPTYGQEDDAISRAFGVRVYPSTYVLGKDGRVLWRSVSFDATAVRAILAATR